MANSWFGWLSAISQLASRVGEGGGVGQLCLHRVTLPYTTWPMWQEQGGGLRSLLLKEHQLNKGVRRFLQVANIQLSLEAYLELARKFFYLVFLELFI
jgi:hypothetical protein